MMLRGKTALLFVVLFFNTLILQANGPVLKTGQTLSYHTGDDGSYQTGAARDYNRSATGVVTDLATELQWQDDYSDNGDTIFQGTRDDAQAYCDALSLEGKDDWRVPRIDELRTLSDWSRVNPAIDPVFVNTIANDYYWSATDYADNPQSAWTVNSYCGHSGSRSITETNPVRCVRGATAPTSTFTRDAMRETVYDDAADLSWLDTNVTTLQSFKWADAIDYCENLVQGGKQDWRLPNINELDALTDYARYGNAIDPAFQNVRINSYYWSSTTRENGISYVYGIYSTDGQYHNSLSKTGNNYLRCVRDGNMSAPSAPTAVTLSSYEITRNNQIGDIVGALGTEDGDVSDSHTYTFCGGTDDALFAIDGGNLVAAAVLDPAVQSRFELCIRTTDSLGSIYDEPVTIQVANTVALPVLRTTQTTEYLPNDDGAYQTGVARDYNRSATGVVTDNTTALQWQDNYADNGNVVFQGTWDEAQTYCDALTQDGKNDWRLPRIDELRTLSDWSRVNPAIDPVFVNTNASSSDYWSDTLQTDAILSAWTVRAYYGNSIDRGITKSNSVRCVRGATPAAATFTRDDVNETVHDSRNSLTWQDDANVTSQTLTWANAIDYCETLALDGKQDWRLPNQNELASIIDFSRSGPAIDPAFQNGQAANYYWSSTTRANSTGHALGLYSDDGRDELSLGKGGAYYLRCVRTTEVSNSTPTAEDVSVTIDENGSKSFAVADFHYADDDGDVMQSITITSLETVGTLTYNGSDVTLGQTIMASDIANLRYAPNADESGSPYDTFGFRVSDGVNDSGTYTMTINVTPDAVWSGHPVFKTDNDNDSIPDEWEYLMYGNLTTVDATSDIDGDGYSDLDEFLVFYNNFDPRSAAGARSEAQNRIPPVIETLNMPERMNAGETYSINWKVMGYDEGYTTMVALFDCTGITDDTCGAKFSDNFYYFQTADATVTSAAWFYNGESAQYFTYAHTFTVPGGSWSSSGTPIVVRFYQKTTSDAQAGKQSLSLMVPGNITETYYDATGRRIRKTLCPSGGCF